MIHDRRNSLLCSLGLHLFFILCLLPCPLSATPPSNVEYYGNQWILHLHPQADLPHMTNILAMHGLAISHQWDVHTYLISSTNMTMLRNSTETSSMEDALQMHPQVLRLEREKALVRTKRGLGRQSKRSHKIPLKPSDPLFDTQFYFGWEGNELLSLNIKEAWRQGAYGDGITIAIIDDGIDYLHPDLKHAFDAEKSIDLNDNDPYPYPRYTDDDFNAHGTKCSGILSADYDNEVCIAGIAPGAKIAFIRLLDKLVLTDAEEARALEHKYREIDIYTASWGPEDTGQTIYNMGAKTKDIVTKMAVDGRGGKGNILIWASGDGGKEDDCNADSYVVSPNVISVAGITREGRIPFFTEMCAAALTSTFGSHVATNSIYGDCDQSFGGTSASAPQAAAIIALLLSARTELTLRDVQHIVVLGSDVVMSASNTSLKQNKLWEINGAGLAFNGAMGFGLLNAGRTVAMGKNWKTVPGKIICPVQLLSTPKFLHALKPVELQYTFHEACQDLGKLLYVEHVQLIVTTFIRKRGDLEVFLESPSKTVSRVMGRRSNDADVTAGFKNWPFMTVKFWNEKVVGAWRVWFTLAPESNLATYGVLLNCTIVFHGTETSPLQEQTDSVRKDIEKHFQRNKLQMML